MTNEPETPELPKHDLLKQVIVMRNDLNMRKGKMIAHGSHASMMFLVESLLAAARDHAGSFHLDVPAWRWLSSGRMSKICVRVDSEAELLDVAAKAKEAGLPVHIITDAGLTEFGGVPTRTCAAIGPAAASSIDPITGHLKLL
ncbi:MAG: aminoacyl-tRNA hydrolase [Bryobacteraceae bacterium]